MFLLILNRKVIREINCQFSPGKILNYFEKSNTLSSKRKERRAPTWINFEPSSYAIENYIISMFAIRKLSPSSSDFGSNAIFALPWTDGIAHLLHTLKPGPTAS
jgi:hypothetical protein